MATAGVKRPFGALDADADAHQNGKAPRVDDSHVPRSKNHTPVDVDRILVHEITPSISTNWSRNGTESPSLAVSRSRDSTPVPTVPVVSTTTNHRPSSLTAFPADASIVLTGIRGAGKSTLAIIASTAMKRRVIDCEKAFQTATGSTSWAYKRQHGSVDCHKRQAEVLKDILSTNSKQCLIVCSWMERSVQSLLRDFSRSHPVILILRDAKAIQDHLRIEDEEKTHSLLTASTAIFRGCSNLEFFNLSESQGDHMEHDAEATKGTPRAPKSPAPYLTLKRAERHFLKFLSLMMPTGSIPFIESAFPLASIPTEGRRFTYALSVPLSKLLRDEFEIQDLETGADAIEIVVDTVSPKGTETPTNAANIDTDRLSEMARAIGSIRRNTVIPIIYHVQFPRSATESRGAEALYMEYLLYGLRLAPEYITVDLRLGDYELSSIAAFKRKSKVIGHYTCPGSERRTWRDPVWMMQYRRAWTSGCDIARLVKPVMAVKDNFDLNGFKSQVESLEGRRIPLIAYNSGARGRHSACMNHILTSVGVEPVTDLTCEDLGQPQITARQATEALYGSFLFDPMKLYVFGAHVDYSLSPAMHNAAFKSLGIPHHYRPYSTPTLRGLKELIEDPYFAGASVGLPFKVESIILTHSLSPHARAIGAINTLIPVRRLNPDGSIPNDETLFNCRNRAGPVRALYGDNTDWVGIRACIRRGLSPANAVRPTTCGLVIGAGGMARAAVYAMLQLGVQNIVIYNRTVGNAEKLAEHFSQLFARKDLPLLSTWSDAPTRFHVVKDLGEPWPAGWRKPTMIVFCIPNHSIGDVPAPNFKAPESWLGSPTGGVLVDLGYKTLDTPILAQARAMSHKGWVTLDGLDLLPEQGFAQFELFTGRRAPRRLMRKHALRAYTDEQGRSNLAQLQPRLHSITEQEP